MADCKRQKNEPQSAIPGNRRLKNLGLKHQRQMEADSEDVVSVISPFANKVKIKTFLKAYVEATKHNLTAKKPIEELISKI